ATNNFEYGDLYLLNLIDNFKVPTPPLDDEYYKSVPKSDINEVDILTFGDSFFAEGARVKNVPARLADTLKKKVFFGRSDNILNFLEEQNYQKKDRKYLILEIVERGIPGTFTDYQNILKKKNNIISNIIETVMPINLEQRYTFLFQKGFLTHYIYKELATLKFSIFGYITSITPVYKKDPPWLFYYMDVNDKKTSFYYKFSDDEIKTICDNISDLSIQLKNSYNLDLILLPVPNKYTIYHKLLNNDEYNNFLPRIYSELKKGNVKVCEVYDLFMKSDKELYYPTDTHWNDEGVKIAVTELLKMIN
ncbi:MAG: hypothetical protein NTU73_06515, partial [Ignavibacteriae bacterium]|nr:hypothetical protein [Ignavibacteriota bacterium]